jgi:S-(hydroxymethyl)glutathione dehydrogenase/alcohol dehydrogenase
MPGITVSSILIEVSMNIKKTKAAILFELKSKLRVESIGLPEHLDVGQVLVKLHYSGICGSQIGEIQGVKGADRFLPHLLGHEGSGEVLAIGPGVTTVAEGDHVVLHWKQGDGINSKTPLYNLGDQTVNAGWVTTFNEHAVISENRLTTIDKTVDFRIAALFGCAVTTGFGVVVNDANLKPGQSIVVYGAGGIGLSIVQAASLVSGMPIIAVDLVESRLALARKLGADFVFNPSICNIEEEVAKLLPAGADIVIDNTGNPRVIERAYQMTSRVGRTVLVGVPAKGQSAELYTLPLHFGKSITGSFGGDTKPSVDIPRYLAIYQANRLELESLITNVYDLDHINDAIEDMQSGAVAGRCIIEMS